ncbi:MAG: ASKHA domain-containing protein, partial [Desulfobacterales bacterium]
DLAALQQLPSALAEGRGRVSATVWMEKEIIAVQAGEPASGLGLAVDIGTTTLAGYLCDLATGKVLATVSAMNPQVKYGEDVISRITYHHNHDDGLKRMSDDLRAGLNRLIAEALGVLRSNGRGEVARENIVDMAVCGNTAMHHILLQLDPSDLGVMPFAPVVRSSLDLKARDLGIEIHPAAHLYVLPNTAGFVGADNVGVILAEEPHKHDEMQLIIDIGTNGELVLGNIQGLVASSCATGPALEGAQIEFGMRAAPGAIERVKIDPVTHEVDYKVVGRDAWRSYSQAEQMQVKGICGSGILDVAGEFFKTGIILKGGAFNGGLTSPRYRENPESGFKEFVLAWAAETSIGREVVITQKDIRQIQLAKAAVYTGCKLMMRRLGVAVPDKVKIAGAFGTHVDRALALVAGLLPDVPLEAVESVGNAAGDGCRMALLDRKKREEADWVARNVTYLELSLEPDFQDELLDALAFPHQRDPFPHLAGIVPQQILQPQGPPDSKTGD